MTDSLHTNNPVALRYLFDETLFLMEQESPAPLESSTSLPIQETAPKPVSVPVIWGKNQRNILFLHATPHHEHLDPASMDAFLKILGALKLGDTDVGLLNLELAANKELDSRFLRGFVSGTRLIVLGLHIDIQSLGIHLDIQPHQSFSIDLQVPKGHSIQGLQTHAFADMLTDDLKKRQFWGVLKEFLV